MKIKRGLILSLFVLSVGIVMASASYYSSAFSCQQSPVYCPYGDCECEPGLSGQDGFILVIGIALSTVGLIGISLSGSVNSSGETGGQG